jgi:hypothetical protein
VRRPKTLNLRSNRGSVTRRQNLQTPLHLFNYLATCEGPATVMGSSTAGSATTFGASSTDGAGSSPAIVSTGTAEGPSSAAEGSTGLTSTASGGAGQTSKVLDVLGTLHLQQQHIPPAKTTHTATHKTTKKLINRLHLLSRPVGSLPNNLPTMRPPHPIKKCPR